MEIHVPDYEWNAHYKTPEEYVAQGEIKEGEEFELVRLQVGAKTTYRVVDGKPMPVVVAFPEGLSAQEEG